MSRLLVVLLIAGTAYAGPKKKPPPPAPAPAPAPEPAPPPPPVDTPWSQGVPVETQTKANALYEQGNTLFAQQAHAPALDKYKQAIALWDHPLIRFNMAVTEIRLDRVLDAADDLDKALRFGATPFKPELYQQALDYQALVKGRVGYVEASCDQAGTKIALDGKPWFTAPGKQKLRVLGGEHAIVGEHQGFLTSSQKVVVSGGATATEQVKLIPLDSVVVLKYRYRRWIPWTITGAGAAVALGGLATWFLGKNGMSQFQTDFATQCPNGCEPGLTSPAHSPLRQERDSAQLKGNVGIAMMGVGGAVAATGLVLVILNRPSRVLPDVEVAPHAGGVTAAIHWNF